MNSKNKFFKSITSFSLLVVLALFVACSGTGKKAQSQETPKITVFAAASLTNVLGELIDSFEVAHHIEVITNMASSGTLARQIEQGGTPEIYISASKKWADYIDTLGLILPNKKEVIAHNQLVLIAPADSKLAPLSIDSTLQLKALIGEDRLSIGDPSHVPAGKYAKQSLDYFGWYESLSDRYLPAKDVRSALMVVELGEAPLGIVYRTDAEESSKVKIVGTFPTRSHQPIVYVSCQLQASDASNLFFDYLNSEASAPIWAKYGFNQ